MTKWNRHPLDVVRRAKAAGIRTVIVGVSGKDSLAALDVCAQHFERVHGYFMYRVKGLRFQEEYLQYLERRYGLEILRVPHFELARLLRGQVLRHPTAQASKLRLVKPRHVEDYVRRHFGASWIATGEKYADSLERNAQIVPCEGLDHKRQRLYPVGLWTDTEVNRYIALRQLPMPPDYRLLPHKMRNFGELLALEEIWSIYQHYPDDYERIRAVFPLVDVQIQRYKQRMEKGLSVARERRRKR